MESEVQINYSDSPSIVQGRRASLRNRHRIHYLESSDSEDEKALKKKNREKIRREKKKRNDWKTKKVKKEKKRMESEE